MADSTLTAIQTKVRRLTRSPSEAQLSTAQLNEYINTFVLYDFPEHLRLFSLRTTFTFYTNPFQDVYPTDIASFVGVTTNPLYNFQNLYITTHDPIYIAGYPSFFSQSRSQFFGIYPMVNNIASIGTTGDGVTTTFTGNIGSTSGASNSNNSLVPILQNNVLFDSLDTNNQGLSLVDVPVIDTTTGNPTTIGNLYVPGQEPTTPPTVVLVNNNIDYVTGDFTITFSAAPGASEVINSQTVPYVAALPQSMLYYDNKFTLRPVPDQPYRVNLEVYKRPAELLDSGQSPELEEQWQYIAYGASKKVFEDRMDMDSVQLIMPEYKKQEILVLRRTLVQQTNTRTATIYTEQTSSQGGGWWGGFGGNF